MPGRIQEKIASKIREIDLPQRILIYQNSIPPFYRDRLFVNLWNL